MDGTKVCCRGCGAEFSTCQRCWRVQRYCGLECSAEGRRASQARSQKKYTKTKRGRHSHAKRQKQYRKNHRQKNSETEHTTRHPKTPLQEKPQSPYCRFCGARVIRFIKGTQFLSFRRMVNAHT